MATHYFAFFRALNVGGRNVKMADLRGLLEDLDLDDVSTYIASGNAVFRSPEDAAVLEKRIEEAVKETLGFEAETYVRTAGEIEEIVARRPFAPAEHEGWQAFQVGFVYQPLDDDARESVLAAATDDDRLAVHGREIYWLSRTKQSQSVLDGNTLARAAGTPATFRGMRTLERMAKKFL